MLRRKFWSVLALAVFTAFLLLGGSPSVKQLTVIGWNVVSGDADPAVIAAAIEAMQGCDIWGLSEMDGASWANMFEEAAAKGESADFEKTLGSTGRRNRLLNSL